MDSCLRWEVSEAPRRACADRRCPNCGRVRVCPTSTAALISIYRCRAQASCSGQLLPSIAGSSPDWRIATLGGGHLGRRHLDARTSVNPVGPLLVNTTLGNRREVAANQETHQSAEPLVWGADRAYYVRRQLHEDLYRRHLGRTERVRTERHHEEGKKCLPVPMGQPRHPEGCMHFLERQMQRSTVQSYATNPQLMHRHNAGAADTKDGKVHRKVRVGKDSYHQTGRAGDLSRRTGPTPRVEDESAYRQHTVDSPSFIRFCNGLPKLLEDGPVGRHAAAMQRQESALQQAAAEAVQKLDAWDVQQQDKLAAFAAQQAAAAVPAKGAGKK